jgi:hypothetical protein
MLQRLGGPQFLLAALTAGMGVRGHLHRTHAEEGVDQPTHERLDPRPYPASFADGAERGLRESPQGVSEEPECDEPDEHGAAGMPRQLLHGATLVGFTAPVSGGQRHGQYPNEQINAGACGQPEPGQQLHGLTAGRLAGRCRRSPRHHRRISMPPD